MIRFYILTIIIISVLSMAIWKPTNAFFVDSAISQANTFTTTEEFPSPTGMDNESPIPSENIANHIVISEVQTSGAGGSDLDFIELYNPTNGVVNLDGFRLVKRNSTPTSIDDNIFTFTSSHNIPAHGYFLWTNSSLSEVNESDVSSSDVLASSSNSIALRQGILDTGIIIDSLSWSPNANALTEGAYFTTVLSPGQSMERKALSSSTDTSMTSGGDASKGNGFDSNNNANDFILRTTSQPQNSGSGTESL